MNKESDPKEERKEERRKRLRAEAQRLEDQRARASSVPDKISLAYRRLSQLDPHAFVAIIERTCDGDKFGIHALSHRVSRGIEVGELAFRLERSLRDGVPDYVLVNRNNGRSRPELCICLNPLQRVSIVIPYGCANGQLVVFFAIKRKDAVEFVREAKERQRKK